MIREPMDILQAYPVRKSRRQKAAFRKDLMAWFLGQGYSCREEKGSFGSRNFVVGDPEKAEYLITAHYDTCARMLIPNLVTPTSLAGFLGYQLLMTALILLVPSAAVIPVALLTNDLEIAELAWYLLLLLMILLIYIGPANPSNANDNTSGVVTVLQTAKNTPQELRSKVCFVLFDLEEAGLIGSASYYRKHRKTAKYQLVLNLDCVGEGDEILFIPTGKLKRQKQTMAQLCAGMLQQGKKQMILRDKGFAIYPSDQANFPLGVGICAVKHGRLMRYVSRIHTPRDTILDEENVSILQSCLIGLVSGSAAQ